MLTTTTKPLPNDITDDDRKLLAATRDRFAEIVGPDGGLVKDCTDRLGYPGCISVAVMERACTCGDGLTLEQHAECERRAAQAFAQRKGSPCDDCAMRPGSPEHENGNALYVAEQAVPFRCHQGGEA